VTEQPKSSLRAAFEAGRSKETQESSTESQDGNPAPELKSYPGPKGRRVPADFPVNLSFTLTAKERYDFTLAMKKRGITATQFLREIIENLND